MKNIFHLFAATTVLFFYSCSRYCCDTPPPPDNFMLAQKDTSAFRALAAGQLIGSDSLKITAIGQNTGTNLHDTLGFKINYSGIGTYQLTTNAAFYHTRVGNGGPDNRYQLDTLYHNILVVTAADQNPTGITGTFDIKFINPANPAGIHFLNGDFKVALNK